MPKVLIHRPCTLWPRIDKAIRRAVKAALTGVKGKTEVGILLTEDAAMRRLNRHHRQRDQATNVLSFAMEEGEKPLTGPPHRRLLGDVVLAYETVAREAQTGHLPLKHHAVHLVVHGVLHLLGYDHERSSDEARRQEKREIAILAKLGVANPYQ
ncbi:MAG: rRNA maturation RNase YbeY [Magnetococcus sp. DMHC-8]